MTLAELYPDLEIELAATRRVLERVPFKHWDWKPHERSFSLGRLATHIAELPSFAEAMVSSDEFDMATSPFPPASVGSTTELVALFDDRSGRLRESLTEFDEAKLSEKWKLRMGEQVFLDAPRSLLLRQHAISHPIHHRAQLIVYLRLLDVPVPGLYGPSADER